jgi:PAS domain S-box-containing protein
MQESKIQYVPDRLDKELHRFIDTIGDIPYVAMPSEKPEIICFAGKVKNLSGYDANEILADKEHWANMIHPDDQKFVFDAFARCKNEGTSFYIEYRIVHKNGSLRYVSDKGEAVFNNKGQVIQVEGVITPLGESREPENIPLLEVKQARNSYVNSNNFQKV